ncbi:DedA family protein [Helicobacter saguini]|uniref:DedA family protein n=1 Tax=Helicobacter saguini TaxID=1548018 RepID=A0A4U8T056_9HELI|nr:DedA family protein [Helicobacter saguini]MWV67680.1 DedA family protein [Helicobacter saguini]TLD92734.1 DedA family protein [Helicobacter saguini]
MDTQDKSSKIKYIIIAIIVLCVILCLYFYLKNSNISFEKAIKEAWENHVEDWGYLILFLWSILEGEWGLLLAGIASHQGYLHVGFCIFIAGLGGFTGDQIYFYIGRLNKGYVQKKFRKQRRKFALASRLMQKYGWPIIFVQRYMYGLRTIIPISIGLTRYSAIKFAIINLISAWVWAAITIVPAWYFGEQILEFLAKFFATLKQNPALFAILSVIILCFIALFLYLKRKRQNSLLKEKNG